MMPAQVLQVLRRLRTWRAEAKCAVTAACSLRCYCTVCAVTIFLFCAVIARSQFGWVFGPLQALEVVYLTKLQAPSPNPSTCGPAVLVVARDAGAKTPMPSKKEFKPQILRAPKRLDPNQQENGSERSGFKGRRGCVPCGDHGGVGPRPSVHIGPDVWGECGSAKQP